MYECIKLCLQWNTIPILAIQYNNKKLNRGQLIWPATCMFSINKVSDDACQWNGHDVVISTLDFFFFIDRFVCYMEQEEKLSIQWPCSSDFRHFATDFCS